MPRAPRVFVDGGCHHVYSRISRGERVFSDPEEAAAWALGVGTAARRQADATFARRCRKVEAAIAARLAGRGRE